MTIIKEEELTPVTLRERINNRLQCESVGHMGFRFLVPLLIAGILFSILYIAITTAQEGINYNAACARYYGVGYEFVDGGRYSDLCVNKDGVTRYFELDK